MPESNSPFDFIELNRTFHELSRGAPESDDADIDSLPYVGGQLGWPDVIREYRVVLLSEAGSGKTAELRNIARNLDAEGRTAFFIRLEYIPSAFEDAFEVGTFEQFNRWIESGDEGWILLDSVDEARLRHPTDFESAIRTLSHRISTATDRAHIVITGRTTAWRPKTDLVLCERRFPRSTSTVAVAEKDEVVVESESTASIRTVRQPQPEDSTFRLVTFVELSREQIKTFLSARGMTDTTAFLQAVGRADAWSFASRPQDLEELIEFWIDEQRIGSQLELMQNSIKRRLEERDQNRAEARPLSSNDARKGVRMLAAAATLGQEPTIRVPDGADNSKGIPVHELLAGWDANKQAALLALPIFDEAVYGVVRFHHRSVREYLAAEWLAELLARETSRRKVEALLFRSQYGLDVVVPRLRPVLPWLAILDGKVSERLRKVAPEVLLEGGDPSQLPLDTRRAILHEICEQIASGTRRRSGVEYKAVQRFASADLAEDVRCLMANFHGNDELTAFLLRMVWMGELAAALPEAKGAALSVWLSTYTRVVAIRAVESVGTEKDLEEVRKAFLEEAPELKREWLAELVRATVPSRQSISWLLAAVTKSAEKERFSVEHLAGAVANFAESTDAALLPQLLSGLNELLGTPPLVERFYCKVSARFEWLLDTAAQTVEKLIRRRHPAALGLAALSVLRKFGSSQDYRMNLRQGGKIDLATLVPKWTELNRALFWHDVEEARAVMKKTSGTRLVEFWHARFSGAFWRFDAEDFDYVVDQIVKQPVGDNRLVALSLAFKFYVENARPPKWRKKLKACCASDTALSARLRNYLHPPPRGEESRNMRRQHRRWRKRAETQKRKEEEWRAKWRESLEKRVGELANPSLGDANYFLTAQYFLHERMREKVGDSGRWTDGDWRCLLDEYGASIARAFRDGAVAHWRRYKPKLRSEGAPFNKTPVPVVVGLTGLSIESKETTDWPASLCNEEADLACRYASHELNGFPSWFPRLFKQNPNAVGDFLVREIMYELSVERPDTDTHYMLDDVISAGEWAWNEIAPRLVALLRVHEPGNTANLRKLLTIVQGASIRDDEVKALAATKCQTLRADEHLAQWFAVWTGVDPDTAIPAFATYMTGMANVGDRTDSAMRYVTSLCGGRWSEVTHVRGAFRTAQHLKSLYLLMHKYIPCEDDIDRAGKGVYSPGLRDEAQQARESLLSFLNRIPGKEGFLALNEISRAHPKESSRSWIALQAKTKAEKDADLEPWGASQVREFDEKLEHTPSNHAELAELATMRLLDLKDDLENGDGSTAALLRNVPDEITMRNYIGQQLREKAFGRYSVPQEEELADRRRPDLRFHGNGFDGPVPIELKLADKWSGRKLFERLENQLCGDYLRDQRSTRGLFVLIFLGNKKKRWDIPGGTKRVDFRGLVAALEKCWQKISWKFCGVDDIMVVGVDLTKRFVRVEPRSAE